MAFSQSELHEEHRSIYDDALSRFRHDVPDGTMFRMFVGVWFGRSTSWAIGRPADDGRCTSRRIQWRADIDAAKLRSPIERMRYLGQALTPTLEIVDLRIDAVVVETILAGINAIDLPGVHEVQQIVTGRGREYEVWLSRDSTGNAYRWLSAPAIMAELVTCADEVFEKLEALHGANVR